MQPLDTIINFVVNAISRRNEFQADKFAFDLSNTENKYTENLKRALVKLGDKNKSVTDVDPLWSAYKHSHPVSLACARLSARLTLSPTDHARATRETRRISA